MSFIGISKYEKTVIWFVIVVICDCNLFRGLELWTECYADVRRSLTGIYGASCISMYFFYAHFIVFRKILFIFVIKLSNLYHRPFTPDYLMRNGSAKVYLMPSGCMVIDRRLPILQMLKTWNNSVMLSLSWRFNVNSKKK